MSINSDQASHQRQNTLQANAETDFVSSSQITTMLGDYSEPQSKQSKGAVPLVLLTILLVLVLIGSGAFMYLQQMQITQTQTRFSTAQAQVDRVSSSALHVFTGNEQAWTTLNIELTQLSNSWSQLKEVSSLVAVDPDYDLFIKEVTDLKNMRDAISPALTALKTKTLAGDDAVSVKAMQEKVLAISNKAERLNHSLRQAERQTLEIFQQQQQMLGYAALVAALVIILIGGLTIRRIGLDKQANNEELGSLRREVELLQTDAQDQRNAAQEQVAAARRVNEANQAAILRLMNELQNLAEGDLTQQATVTEDITGAIADSVNYTMEELRNLVSQVQSATELVSKTTATVESTSTELLASSDEQLREIRETGQAVLDVAVRINNVSTQAQQSATVARQSLDAAEKGMLAVQNAIGGMNTIRDQIQDTSKRIKRLVESSQEIGEITDLIADITEQTNVLALNAAIQAASAGEAGRGFSVVAEEVQRLAERSAAATRQIASLIKSIQGDMQDAMAAMERSTRGVVEGARQSDETGTAFTEIDSVTRRLASLIQEIAEQTQHEAVAVNGVAENIQHIFAVTEQTAEGTRSTASQVRELARVAEQLERSVARFRIS